MRYKIMISEKALCLAIVAAALTFVVVAETTTTVEVRTPSRDGVHCPAGVGRIPAESDDDGRHDGPPPPGPIPVGAMDPFK